MQRHARRRGRPGEGGQMLILAGTVLLLAFLVVVFTVSELASEEASLQRGVQSELVPLFRENQAKIHTTLSGLVVQDTDNATLIAFVDSSRAEVEERGRAHGLQVFLELGNVSAAKAAKSERDLTREDGSAYTCPGSPAVTRKYDVSSYDLSRDYRLVSWDCGDDGILWDRDQQRIRGVIVYLVMSSSTARLEDTFVVPVN